MIVELDSLRDKRLAPLCRVGSYNVILSYTLESTNKREDNTWHMLDRQHWSAERCEKEGIKWRPLTFGRIVYLIACLEDIIDGGENQNIALVVVNSAALFDDNDVKKLEANELMQKILAFFAERYILCDQTEESWEQHQDREELKGYLISLSYYFKSDVKGA